MSKDEALVDPVPECVAAAESDAESLYKIVMETAFPELPASLPELPTAIQITLDARNWGSILHDAHAAAARHFPRREMNIEVEIPRVDIQFNTRHPLTSVGRTRRRHAELDIPGDVIEPIPPRFEESMVSAFPVELSRSPFGHEQTDAEFVDAAYSENWSAETWDNLRRDLVRWQFIVRVKCLGLVGWVRARADELRHATIPNIDWLREAHRENQVLRIEMAGMRREVELQQMQFRMLRSLATGQARASRKVKHGLVQAIPELAPYIIPVPGESRGDTTYDVSPTVRSRWSVPPKPE